MNDLQETAFNQNMFDTINTRLFNGKIQIKSATRKLAEQSDVYHR